MPPYVIRNDDTGRWVAPPGQAHSYTTDILAAHVYATTTEALIDKCPNESIIDVAALFTESPATRRRPFLGGTE